MLDMVDRKAQPMQDGPRRLSSAFSDILPSVATEYFSHLSPNEEEERWQSLLDDAFPDSETEQSLAEPRNACGPHVFSQQPKSDGMRGRVFFTQDSQNGHFESKRQSLVPAYRERAMVSAADATNPSDVATWSARGVSINSATDRANTGMQGSQVNHGADHSVSLYEMKEEDLVTEASPASLNAGFPGARPYNATSSDMGSGQPDGQALLMEGRRASSGLSREPSFAPCNQSPQRGRLLEADRWSPREFRGSSSGVDPSNAAALAKAAGPVLMPSPKANAPPPSGLPTTASPRDRAMPATSLCSQDRTSSPTPSSTTPATSSNLPSALPHRVDGRLMEMLISSPHSTSNAGVDTMSRSPPGEHPGAGRLPFRSMSMPANLHAFGNGELGSPRMGEAQEHGMPLFGIPEISRPVGRISHNGGMHGAEDQMAIDNYHHAVVYGGPSSHSQHPHTGPGSKRPREELLMHPHGTPFSTPFSMSMPSAGHDHSIVEQGHRHDHVFRHDPQLGPAGSLLQVQSADVCAIITSGDGAADMSPAGVTVGGASVPQPWGAAVVTTGTERCHHGHAQHSPLSGPTVGLPAPTLPSPRGPTISQQSAFSALSGMSGLSGPLADGVGKPPKAARRGDTSPSAVSCPPRLQSAACSPSGSWSRCFVRMVSPLDLGEETSELRAVPVIIVEEGRRGRGGFRNGGGNRMEDPYDSLRRRSMGDTSLSDGGGLQGRRRGKRSRKHSGGDEPELGVPPSLLQLAAPERTLSTSMLESLAGEHSGRGHSHFSHQPQRRATAPEGLLTGTWQDGSTARNDPEHVAVLEGIQAALAAEEAEGGEEALRGLPIEHAMMKSQNYAKLLHQLRQQRERARAMREGSGPLPQDGDANVSWPMEVEGSAEQAIKRAQLAARAHMRQRERAAAYPENTLIRQGVDIDMVHVKGEMMMERHQGRRMPAAPGVGIAPARGGPSPPRGISPFPHGWQEAPYPHHSRQGGMPHHPSMITSEQEMPHHMQPRQRHVGAMPGHGPRPHPGARPMLHHQGVPDCDMMPLGGGPGHHFQRSAGPHAGPHHPGMHRAVSAPSFAGDLSMLSEHHREAMMRGPMRVSGGGGPGGPPSHVHHDMDGPMGQQMRHHPRSVDPSMMHGPAPRPRLGSGGGQGPHQGQHQGQSPMHCMHQHQQSPRSHSGGHMMHSPRGPHPASHPHPGQAMFHSGAADQFHQGGMPLRGRPLSGGGVPPGMMHMERKSNGGGGPQPGAPSSDPFADFMYGSENPSEMLGDHMNRVNHMEQSFMRRAPSAPSTFPVSLPGLQ